MTETTERPTWRRRNYLVRKRFQLRFIALLLLQMSVILASVGVLVYTQVHSTQVIARSLPFASGTDYVGFQTELIDRVHGFYARSLGLIGITTCILVLFGLLASHKLAGPIVKLERYLLSLADGDYSQRIAFRRYDHLDDFAASVNRAIEAVENRRLRAKELAIELCRRGTRLDQPGDRERTIAEMENVLLELREAA